MSEKECWEKDPTTTNKLYESSPSARELFLLCQNLRNPLALDHVHFLPLYSTTVPRYTDSTVAHIITDSSLHAQPRIDRVEIQLATNGIFDLAEEPFHFLGRHFLGRFVFPHRLSFFEQQRVHALPKLADRGVQTITRHPVLGD